MVQRKAITFYGDRFHTQHTRSLYDLCKASGLHNTSEELLNESRKSEIRSAEKRGSALGVTYRNEPKSPRKDPPPREPPQKEPSRDEPPVEEPNEDPEPMKLSRS